MSSRVFVAIPTLGNRATLTRTVSSIRALEWPELALRIVCPARAVEAVRGRCGDVPIDVERTAGGIYRALNPVLQAGAGAADWLAYLNDDDYWLPAMRALLAVAATSPDVDIVYGRVAYVDAAGHTIFESTSSARYRAFPLLAARGVVMFTQQAVLMRAEVFRKLDGFDCDYQLAADTDLWVRAARAGFRGRYVNCVAAAYTLQPDQLSADATLRRREQEMLLAKNSLERGSWSSWLEVMRYRCANAGTYCKRLFRGRGLAVEANVAQR